MEEKSLQELCVELQKLFSEDCSGHDYWHTMRVYQNAMKIADKEICDRELVALAALLHDADDEKLFPGNHFENAGRMMCQLGIDNETQNRVMEIIEKVSFKGTGEAVPETIEGKIVQDADRLDALGAIGIARAFAYGGSRGRSMYEPGNSLRGETTVAHFYEKLFRLKDKMNTDTAKAMAQSRDAFMREFLDTFYEECYQEAP